MPSETVNPGQENGQHIQDRLFEFQEQSNENSSKNNPKLSTTVCAILIKLSFIISLIAMLFFGIKQSNDYQNKLKSLEIKMNELSDYKQKLVQIQWETDNIKSKIISIENNNDLAKQKLLKFEDSMSITKNSLENNIKRIDALEYNTVPVGFIYFQLPDQQQPSNIWSFGNWKEISSEYAGLFFRVLGNTSEQFGVLQNESSNRLTNVKSQTNNTGKRDIIVNPGVWSEWIPTGMFSKPGSARFETSFLLSGEEVKPRNKAIRIWKRIK